MAALDDGTRVLDASAVLAWLREEPGVQVVEERLSGSVISAVNLSKVLQKSLAVGSEVSGASLVGDLSGLGLSFVGFRTEEAYVAASMWSAARPLGLGLADRACLATAVVLGVPALTADRPWRELEWEGLSVEVIR